MTKLFAMTGTVKTTIVTPPLNAPFVSTTSKSSGVNLDMNRKFFMAADLFQQPFEQMVQECKPDCLVVDMFFTWATDTAHKFGIPSAAQLKEIALAIEMTGHNFIWVIRKEHEEEGWLPEGFEKRMEGKGVIIRCFSWFADGDLAGVRGAVPQ
ncbi:hypothetical protein F3Y22_tig00113725pilonHSYRG00925 [Hibiscus syriacus]|uniref:Uncharacterized protein n=1 Tax=Hibiscus syriacus TaxID=106335 RepID=A0A6A2X3F3_HIBSY|nr:hypothetical protein F3Y22_tig00113725pilonHSYRG00925 [Hibiscus syriacus]